MRIRLCCFLLLIPLLVSGCVHKLTSVRHSAEFNNRDIRAGEIIIIPTEATVATVDVLGKKTHENDNYEDHIGRIIDDSILDVLREHQYKVTLLTRKNIADLKISGKILDLRLQYNDIIQGLYKSQWMQEEQAFSVDQKVNVISDLKKSDKRTYLVLCNYVGTSKTSGARIAHLLMDALINTRASDEAETSSMLIGIIDNSNGKFYWSNRTGAATSVVGAALNSGSSDEIDRKHSKLMIRSTLNPLVFQYKSD